MRLRLLTLAAGLAAVAALPGCERGVLNAPPDATITLSADPSTIPESGGAATIRAVVRLPDGSLVPDGVIVNFFTTLGAIGADARTASGTATVTLLSDGTAGKAVVSALSGGTQVTTVEVTFGNPAQQVRVSFNPSALPEAGGTATVLVQVTDASGTGLAGRAVTLSASSGTLGSRGQTLFTDAQGSVTDTLTTTATSTVTATVVGGTASATATIAVSTGAGAAIVLFAEPPTLPLGGGTTAITAFVTDAGSAPVAGVSVSFTATDGDILPAAAVTDASGRARATLDTGAETTVTGRAGSLQATVLVSLGAGTEPYRIVLGAARTSLSDLTPAQGNACLGPPASANAQMPIDVVAQVTDLAGLPIGGVVVTLSIEDTSDSFDGKGGFCGTTAAAACLWPAGSCVLRRGVCPSPPLTAPVCCNSGTLPKTKSVATDTAGFAHFSFAFEDTDLCACVFARRRCVARFLASAPLASGANDLVISFTP